MEIKKDQMRIHSAEDDSFEIGTGIATSSNYLESPEIQSIANTIIAERGYEYAPAEIGYYLQYPNINKKTLTKVVKSSDLLTHFSGVNYFVIVSGEVFDSLDESTKTAVIWNALLKIDPTYKSKTGDWKFNLRRPNFNTFHTINDAIGSEWYKTVQAVTSSFYDLDPKEEEKVTP